MYWQTRSHPISSCKLRKAPFWPHIFSQAKCNASLLAESSTRWLLCEMGWNNPEGRDQNQILHDRLILHSKNWRMFPSCQNNITITPDKTKMYSWIPMPDPFSVPKYTPNVLLNIYAVSLTAFLVMLWLIGWFSVSRNFPHHLGKYMYSSIPGSLCKRVFFWSWWNDILRVRSIHFFVR